MNPALPGGAPSDAGGEALDAWLVSGRLSYAGVPYKDLQQGTEPGPNPDQLRVNVHLLTTELALTAPWQTKFSVQLPTGRLATSTVASSRTDTDIGDAELRVQQMLPAWNSLRLGLTAGVVLATGPYVPKSGAANLPPEASYLTLGRGVTWAIAEAQLSTSLSEKASVYGELAGRTPLQSTEDDFEWGSEVRGVIGGRWQLPHGFSALAIAEWQWRGSATEPDPFVGGRIESANAGGHWLTAMPTVGYQISSALSVLGGARVLAYSDVRGNQLVPSVGGFLSLSGRYSFAKEIARSPKDPGASSSSPPAPTPVLGKITIVDYWATWCAPCKKIDVLLGKAKPSWPDVVIKKVDASAYPDSSVLLPEGANGLPVIEIYGEDGERRHLLMGPEALNVVDIVNALRRH